MSGEVIFTARRLFSVNFTNGFQYLRHVNVSKAFVQFYHRKSADVRRPRASGANVRLHNVRINIHEQLEDKATGKPQLLTFAKLLDTQSVITILLYLMYVYRPVAQCVYF